MNPTSYQSTSSTWRPYLAMGLILLFFLAFLFYPLIYIIGQAFQMEGTYSLQLFRILFSNPATVEAMLNSLKLGIIVTIATTILTIPLALLFQKYQFPGKTIISGLLLLPLIIPPFVGAIGFKQLLARFGSINLLLLQFKIISEPIDWLGGAGFWGVMILETIHLYPIMFLNLSASMSSLAPIYEEAAQGLGAGFFYRLRTIVLPLVLPGYFAGAIIVFLWAMADLGTPLVFNYSRVIPVMIFHMVTDINTNPMGYALVVFIMAFTLLCFVLSKRYTGSRQYELYSRGFTTAKEIDLAKELFSEEGWRKRTGSFITLMGIYLSLIVLLFLSVLPHLGVVITSLSEEWFMTILPEKWTFRFYTQVFHHPLALSSIRMSLFLSICSTAFDIVLGLIIAYLVTRRKITGSRLLDILTMMTLTIPGIILAFGYVACFSDTPLDPRRNPVPILIIAYALRRLPYMVRSAYAGFLQSSISLEEASASLGASAKTTFLKITFPLIFAHVLVGGVLSFAFAMLEVSDSLILAMQEKYYPITKTIWYLTGQLPDGPGIASAMGVLGMLILMVALLIASQLLGKKIGELFRT